ncbi:hypothetical protein SEVIR_4G036300v4 [Setaria viridis]|uniref:Uncharacterized protein n=1 Tax=Setaria viridis TaxID=4556 RepID=A0A4U6UWL2_SETVI|nr:uncharacterized protein LOC117852709 [Setaria viridis]XP_034590811.1 uncharacterized protein LOC117852709 [Setaria viridis]TKW19683.1 hypothetical protein SEVIR_4G036300v2 [Setaria viridis]TKW19684.1 hypothetical protein SEVIR_4G036300v2 [Setaria viridis]
MAELNDAPRFALCVALGVSYIIKPLLEFLEGATPLGPVLHAAVGVVLVALPFAYLMSIVLLQLRLAPVQALPPDPAPARRFACLACTMVAAVLVVLAVPLIALWFLAGGWPPRGGL